MKVFSTLHDGAVKVSDVPPGHAFTPRGWSRSVFLRTDGFGGKAPQFRIFGRDANYCIDSRSMGDMVAGVNIELGELVMFPDSTMVIPLPSYLTTGKYEP